MATVHIVLASVNNRARSGGTMPVMNTSPVSVDSVTSSTTSAQSDVAVPTTSAADGLVWSVTAQGGDIYVKFGSNPTAASGEDWLVLDGTTREWSAASGDKVAVIDA